MSGSFVQGTSLTNVFRRDRAAERAALALSGETNRALLRSTEVRHYYIQVDECKLEHVSHKRGSRYDEGVVTPIKSWSMKYTKTRCGREDPNPKVGRGHHLVSCQWTADDRPGMPGFIPPHLLDNGCPHEVSRAWKRVG